MLSLSSMSFRQASVRAVSASCSVKVGSWEERFLDFDPHNYVLFM